MIEYKVKLYSTWYTVHAYNMRLAIAIVMCTLNIATCLHISVKRLWFDSKGTARFAWALFAV